MEMNIYKRARIAASDGKSSLSTLDGAAKELGLSDSTLSRYECDFTPPPPETVVQMSHLYQQPNLRRQHCRRYCAIGKLEVPSDDQNDLMTYGYMANKQLADFESYIEHYKKCMEDGKLTDTEKLMLKDKHLTNLYAIYKGIKDVINELEKDKVYG